MTPPLTAADIERESEVLACIIRADTAQLSPNLSRVLSLRDHAFTDPNYKQIAAAVWMVRHEGQDPVNAVTIGRLLHGDTLMALASVLQKADEGALPDGIAEEEAGELLKPLPPEVLAKAKVEAPPKDEWAERLAARAFNFNRKPPELVPVFSLCGNPVCTPGNITSIVSQAKTGKSAVIGAMMAATMADEFTELDLLGFSSSNAQGFAVVHFDTEQAPDDSWHVVARAISRAGLSEPPPWLLSYCLTGFSSGEAWEAVQAGIKLAVQKFGGLHSAMIDGVGDLVHDVNDAGECNEFVAKLHGLAIRHNAPIIGVLHFNPQTAKARGHLGSQLERKAESNLRLDKEEDGATVLWSDKQRRSAIPKGMGPRFHWSDDKGMHVSMESFSEAKRGAQAEAEIPARDDVFMEHRAMRYNDLVEAIQKTLKTSQRTAQRRLTKWQKLGIIECSAAKLWIAKD